MIARQELNADQAFSKRGELERRETQGPECSVSLWSRRCHSGRWDPEALGATDSESSVAEKDGNTLTEMGPGDHCHM